MGPAAPRHRGNPLPRGSRSRRTVNPQKRGPARAKFRYLSDRVKQPAKKPPRNENAPAARRPRIVGLWWKLPLAMVPLVLLVGVFAHAIWSRVERGRVEQRVAALRAAGVPAEPGDLVEPTLSDGENLAVPIQAALARMSADKALQERREAAERADPNAFALPLTQAEVALLRESLSANAAALDALAAVDGRREAAWGLFPAKGPLIDVLLPHLSKSRQVALLLADAARLAAHEGRWADCMQALGRIEPLAEASAANRFIIGTVVAHGVRALASDVTIAVAPDLAPAGLADRARVAALIATMLDDAPPMRAGRDGVVAERVFCRDMLAQMRKGNIQPMFAGGTRTPTTGGRILSLAATPVLYRGEGLALDYFEEQVRLADAPSQAAYDAASARAVSMYNEMRTGSLTMLATAAVPALDRYHAAKFRSITDRHLAATALALRLYQLDHDGRRPATLEALVPAYLPSVPVDAIDGRPLRYDPARAILWSVGENNVDDGGDGTAVPKKYYAGPGRWDAKDAVVHLDRQPRPATQPSEAP